MIQKNVSKTGRKRRGSALSLPWCAVAPRMGGARNERFSPFSGMRFVPLPLIPDELDYNPGPLEGISRLESNRRSPKGYS